MYRFLPAQVLGALATLAVALNVLVIGGTIVPLGFVKFAVPDRRWREAWTRLFVALAEGWVRINGLILATTQPTVVEVRGGDHPALRRDGRYLVISNHQTWSDVPILQCFLRPRIPFLRFFIKQELIWVPVLGLAWWALDMPFMKRYPAEKVARRPELKGRDLETTRRACDRFRRGPVSIMNFVEGTRFTPAKRAAQGSPYRHLLKPKAGGIAAVLDALSGDLDTLVDVTIAYGKRDAGFVDLVSARIPRVIVDIQVREIPAHLRGGDYAGDEAHRERFQEWVRELWEEKDRRLESMQRELSGDAPRPS